MRFLNRVLGLLGTLLLLAMGILFVSLSLRLFLIEDITNGLAALYESPKIRLVMGAIGSVILIALVALTRMIVQQFQRERTIAFRNPEGEVTVALEAIEDFIKKVGSELSGVKEIKPYAKATRSGILITIRATLWADTHIPEATEELQTIIRGHIHDLLGVEESLTIHVHVGKVIPRAKNKNTLVEEKVI